MANAQRQHRAPIAISEHGQHGVLFVGFDPREEACLDRDLIRAGNSATCLLEALKKLKPDGIALVLLSSKFTHEELMLFFREARRRGFRGFVFHGVGGSCHNPIPDANIGESLRTEQNGALNPAEQTAIDKRQVSFTEKERTVLERVSGGWTNRQIARDLGCSEGAVKAILQQLFQKLQVRKRAQIVRFAFERGLRISPLGHKGDTQG